MAIALTGKYYSELSDHYYVNNIHSMQPAYLKIFDVYGECNKME